MRSAIWIATLKGYHKLADLLIRSGVNLSEPIGQYQNYDVNATLLHLASESGKRSRVQLLLRHGANANARDSRGRTPLHYAVTQDHAEVVSLLLAGGAKVDASDVGGLTSLHIAVLKQAENSAKVLLEGGADVEARDSRGWNALHLAVLVESVRLTEILLRHGISVNARDMLMWTPLYFALNNAKEHMVQLLLDFGADINTKSKDGYFPLYYAVATENIMIVKLLLTNGADVNEKTREGDTALHMACEKGLEKIAHLLLNHKADINIKNESGIIALELAKKENIGVSQTIIKHIVKMEDKNAFINEDNLRTIETQSSFRDFYTECQKEIKKMKKEKIVVNSDISYYYIFSKGVEKLASLTRNRDLVFAFEQNDCTEQFSVYAQDLETKFAIAKRRRDFLFSMEICLHSILCHIPRTIIEKIVSYLKFEDFNVI